MRPNYHPERSFQENKVAEKLSVWEPEIQQPNECQLWISGGSSGGDLNDIEAGRQIIPDLYGDSNTRLFTCWASDAYQTTSCYNLLFSGFIQINSEIAMGTSISPVSNYQTSQYDISTYTCLEGNLKFKIALPATSS